MEEFPHVPNIQALVVDDSLIMRTIIVEHLKRIGITGVKQAFNGENALKTLKEHEGEMDLIISDWNMPGMQGIDLLIKVRNNEKYKNTAFLMVTAEKTTSKIVHAIQEGASGFLPKPFTAEKLKSKICKIFENRPSASY